MIGLLGCESHQMVAVQRDAVVVDVVWIFFCNGLVHARCRLAHVLASLSVGREDDVALAFGVRLTVDDIAHPVVSTGHRCQTVLLAVV